ncbi:hypothetical protein CRUP_008372, partial [Coryphaenoides rupestris]
EEGGGDISGTQFVCETVIRSLTLEEAPDHAPLRGTRPGNSKELAERPEPRRLSIGLKASLPAPLKACLPGPLSVAPPAGLGSALGPSRATLTGDHKLTEQVVDTKSMCADARRKGRGLEEEEKHAEGEEEKREEWMRSRSSSASSEDYIIILPDSLSQPGDPAAETPTYPETTPVEEREALTATTGPGVSVTSSANDMLCTSQTLDDEPLTPEVVAPPTAVLTPSHPGITDGLVKGALSVAASAYKALCTGQGPTQ